MCELFGEEKCFDGENYFAFPSVERIAALEVGDLAPIRAGYRAEYIIAAARAVCDGSLELEALAKADHRTAVQELRRVRGIGEKVANCVVLFGLGHMEAFPIDVWMKRALSEHFPPDFDPQSLGSYAGLAQQYIFYYARSMGR